MRLGELKRLIDLVINESNQIVLETESLYEGKRFLIKGYSNLIRSLDSLQAQPWLTAEAKIVNELINRAGKKLEYLEVSPEEHSQIKNFVNNINKQLPLFYGILSQMVSEQENTVLNIKIPTREIKELNDFTEFNEELSSILDLIVKYKGLNGDYSFKGIDKGSTWYELLILGGPLVYPTLLGIIDIANRLIELRTKWYESEDVRLSVEAKKKENNSKENIEELIETHIHMLVEIKMEKLVEELLENLDELPNQQGEMRNSIIAGLRKMIALIEKGAEFQPSLNPPDYIKNISDKLYEIDYGQLKKSIEQQNQPEKLEHQPSEDEQDDE
jgi:hypothetical protein